MFDIPISDASVHLIGMDPSVLFSMMTVVLLHLQPYVGMDIAWINLEHRVAQ